MTAACAQCGRPFAARRSTARFCGTACRVASHRDRTTAPKAPAALPGSAKRRTWNGSAVSEGHRQVRETSAEAVTLSPPPLLLLLLEPVPSSPARFVARLDGEVIVTSDQPIVDAARELLRRNQDAAALLGVRHIGSAHDAFPRRSIREWAAWTYTEGAARPLMRLKWAPSPFASMSDDAAGGPWPIARPPVAEARVQP